MSHHEQAANRTRKLTLEKFRRRTVPIDFEVIIETRRREKQHPNPSMLVEPGHQETSCAVVFVEPHQCHALGRIVFVFHGDRLNARELAAVRIAFHVCWFCIHAG